MSEARYLLGIDAGTSVVKVAIFDASGEQRGMASRRSTIRAPEPGWAEMSMEETWQAAVLTIREALQAAGVAGSSIAAIGVTGNMVGAWLVDAQGQPVRPAILWSDSRTQPLIERLSQEQPGFMERIFSFSGSVMQQGCTLPLVRWLAEHEPESLARAHRVLCCKDWIRFKLTGDLHLDPSEAAVLPGDARAQDYGPALFDMLGIADQRALFPPVAPAESLVGSVSAAAAEATGLRAGTPVACGAGDVPAVILGSGASDPGVACTILGTTCINGLVVAEPVFEPANVGLLFSLPGRRWLRAFVNVAGTTNLDWFIEQLGPAERAANAGPSIFAALEELARQSPVGARGVLYHPYLSAVGIIAPLVEPAARAQFFGLSSEHTRADMLRAVYEGLALAIRDCYAMLALPPSEIRLSGGGARSAFWSQIIADCSGVPVLIPRGEELGARGAALLAAVGLGWFGSVVEAVRATSSIARAFEPNPAQHLIYSESYALYRDLARQLQPLWQRRSRLPGAI